jgi:UDP-N-acetylmuramoyl-L-alanyl-D-glutamate--2,6-diaminopimelate ligase
VFGCGGDRDKAKRPKMGKAASLLSDHCIVTSDNPRSEDPHEIIRSIVTGMDALYQKKSLEIEPDRATAIRKALAMARRGDFVLIAGKGHETTQVIKGRSFPFDDKDEVLKIISA